MRTCCIHLRVGRWICLGIVCVWSPGSSETGRGGFFLCPSGGLTLQPILPIAPESAERVCTEPSVRVGLRNDSQLPFFVRLMPIDQRWATLLTSKPSVCLLTVVLCLRRRSCTACLPAMPLGCMRCLLITSNSTISTFTASRLLAASDCRYG